MWNDRSLSPACSRNLPAEAASAAESLSPAEHRASRRPGHHRRGLEPELPPLLTPTVEFQPLVVLGAPEKRLQLLVRRDLLHTLLPALARLLPATSAALYPPVAPVVPLHGVVPPLRAFDH